MELREAIEKRHSVRRYKAEPVPEELVTEILRLAAEAPSAGNLKPYRVIVTEKQLTRIAAPVSLVVCALPEVSARRYGDRGRNLYAIQDATIFGAYAQLVAVDLGLSSVWIGAFREGRVRQALGLETGIRPIAIILLGYEDG